jgi:dihydrofolate reductase
MSRRIVAGLFMTLDGSVHEPGEWSFPYFNDQVGEVINANMQSSDAMLLGRRTWEAWADYWPKVKDEQDPFAGYINNVQKYVVSTTLREPLSWQPTELLTGVDQVAKLKDQPGKDIAISGSITLVGSLLREGLLDELSLLLEPIVLGKGKRLYEDAANPVGLQLVESRTLDNGVLSLRYQRAS